MLSSVTFSYPCIECGLCCKQFSILNNQRFNHLNRGDGICKHFNEEMNNCTIYSERPDDCDSNKVWFLHHESINQYVAASIDVCVGLMLASGNHGLVDDFMKQIASSEFSFLATK